MNKTVNINLAGIFFHIDEDAYSKLQRYLEAIKRSFTDSQGRSEIILDIEARIAELFNERIKNEKQVISISEVEEVIAILGQPEDYIVDEEIFEDEPQPKQSSQSTRKLFRDTDNAYIGGVSSGLGHYFGIEPLWIRLAWVILFFSLGTGFLIYILLWILMPAATTTAEKLSMSGKPVNITNIEKKVKEGFSSVKESIGEVADKVKQKDFSKVGNKVQSTSRSFFDALGNVIMFFFKIIAKFIGIILIIVGATTFIALIIALFSVGVADVIQIPGLDFINGVNTSNIPIWFVSILTLFAVGIPFFFIFLLGLKILANNLKSIGNVAKFTLLGFWLISIITLAVISVKELSEHAIETSVTEKVDYYATSNDTINIKMKGNDKYIESQSGKLLRRRDFKIVHDDNNKKRIYSSNVNLSFRSTKDSVASFSIEKGAQGKNYQDAKLRATNIDYNYTFEGNEIVLNSYLLTDFENKFRDQEVEIIIYLPEGTIIYLDSNTKSFLSHYSSDRNIISNDHSNHLLKIVEDDAICLDCKDRKNYKVNIDIKNEDSEFIFDKNGMQIKDADVNIKVNSEGITGEVEDVKVKIDSNGIDIKSNNK